MSGLPGYGGDFRGGEDRLRRDAQRAAEVSGAPKVLRVELGEDGHPKDPKTLVRVAREHVIVRFEHLRT